SSPGMSGRCGDILSGRPGVVRSERRAGHHLIPTGWTPVGKKAAKKSTTTHDKPATAVDAAAVSSRCSPTDALNLLIPALKPRAAAAKLTRAVHDDDGFPIICNGVVIKDYIAPRLTVVAQRKRGRWTGRIVSTFAVGGVKPTDVWEFRTDKV